MRQKIIIGPVDEPLLVFENDALTEITETTSVAMVGAELTIDSFVPVVKYELLIKQKLTPADRDTYSGFVTADNKILFGKFNYNIRTTPYGTPVHIYKNGRKTGQYYLNKVDRLARNMFKINCFSAVGLWDKQRHTGGIYTGERFGDVLQEIIGTEYEYEVAPDVAALQVYGWLPYGTKRSSLHQLLLAYGVTLAKSDTGGILFTFISAEDSFNIETERIYNEGSVVYGEEASRVEIQEHAYYHLNTAAYEELYDTRGDIVENTIVVFGKPIYKDSLTVDEGAQLSIIESGTNYAVISGSGTLRGQPYIHTTKLIAADNESAPTEKVVAVQDATLITFANSENCLKRISEFYFHATTVKNSIVLDSEAPGKRYLFLNPFREYTSAFLTNISTFGSNITKAECEFVQDYIPVATGASFLYRTILEPTEEEQIWNIPESVYEKDVPQIRVVLIGAGYDGAAGSDGENGQPGDDYDGGDGGPGGLGGKGGAGGRILSVSIDASNLAFIRYGKTDKNTWLRAGDSYYSSQNGRSSASGFSELFSGAVYALPGSDGVDGAAGGKGGSYPPIAAVGTKNEKTQPGTDVEFNGVTYKGGKGADRKIMDGPDVGIGSNMKLYFGGCGGGGAAPGADGEDGTVGLWKDDADEWVWNKGGDGADALEASPTVALYGSGGNGGSGGGGGGGNGNLHWWNYVYTTLISVGNSAEITGKGGKGSAGTAGYKGCIIIYY